MYHHVPDPDTICGITKTVFQGTHGKREHKMKNMKNIIIISIIISIKIITIITIITI